jgi:hypothetical protein
MAVSIEFAEQAAFRRRSSTSNSGVAVRSGKWVEVNTATVAGALRTATLYASRLHIQDGTRIDRAGLEIGRTAQET